MARSPQGSGSIYRRSSDGRWIYAEVKHTLHQIVNVKGD